jgi:alpha-ketoglutarate-dependent taurine dioxygenase
MNQIKITPIGRTAFGAVVTDISLPGLSDPDFETVNGAFLKYGFLVFPKQFVTKEESYAFGERFGELEFGAWTPPGVPEKPLHFSKIQLFRTIVGNETWHTDSTYKPVSAKVGMLSAVTVPDEGGQTELADMRAGYAALDEATKKRVEKLSAYHSAQYSQANDVADFPPQRADSIYHHEAYLRPLVKTHPQTGMKNLFVGRHAFGIPGLDRQESRDLLKYLVDFVVSDESRVYCHEWEVGDTMIWDNRALLHRARPHDYNNKRELIQTRVAGDPATELSYYPSAPEAQAGRETLAAELELLRKETIGKRFSASEAAARD